VTIRYITLEDVAQLQALDEKCFSNEVRYNRYDLAYYISLEDSIGLIETLEKSDTMLSFLIVTMFSHNTANIVTIDVEPAFRNQGIGSRLINAVKIILQESKINKITLQVSIKNTPAINFYRKHGFEVIRLLPNYYPSSDGYQMVCLL